MNKFKGYAIEKKNNLSENFINGNFLFESSFSDYELYQILEANGYKTTSENKNILKEGLESGRYVIYDELDELLREDFKEYLNEDPIILGEDILTEGKILNKIRWKLALFSLRFLREKSINDFFLAYYADKDGNPTDKGKEFIKNKKKIKLKKMRELANNMKEEDKTKVCNSEAAKQAERSGIASLVAAGVSGAAAGTMAYTSNLAKNAAKNAKANDMGEIDRNDTNVHILQNRNGKITSDFTTDQDTAISLKTDNGHNIGSYSGNNIERDAISNHGKGATSIGSTATFRVGDTTGGIKTDTTAIASIGQDTINMVNNNNRINERTINTASAALSSISSILFGVMWGSIILAGVSAVRGILKFHKANTLRRDEILAELKKDKNKNTLHDKNK